jgi:hypothetical protein
MPRPNAAPDAAEVIQATPTQIDDFDDGLEGEGKSMEQLFLEAGARRSRQGNWFRDVPDPKKPKRRIVDGGRVYLETEHIRRPVAVAANWQAALEIARASGGKMDALLPGIGWVRGGTKIEREHPDNVGLVGQLGPIRTTREEVDTDDVAAEQALAMRPVLDAVANDSFARSRAQADDSAAAPRPKQED